MNERRNLPEASSTDQSTFSVYRHQLDRLFDDFTFGYRPPVSSERNQFLPSTELTEDDKTLKLAMELPGLDTQDVKITAEDRMITVSGEKKQAQEKNEAGVLRTERSYGYFMRSFTTPFVLDADKVDAKFDKGVLTITIQKPEGQTSNKRQIEIKH